MDKGRRRWWNYLRPSGNKTWSKISFRLNGLLLNPLNPLRVHFIPGKIVKLFIDLNLCFVLRNYLTDQETGFLETRQSEEREV